MSLKDRIEEWYFDRMCNQGSLFSPYPDPLVVNSSEFKRAIEMSQGPLVHKKGKTILKIDGFEVHFKVLNFNDYLKQIEMP